MSDTPLTAEEPSESGGCEWQLVAAKRLGAMVRLLAESKSLTTRAEQAEARVAELTAAIEEARVAAETIADLIEASHYEPAEMQAAQSAVNLRAAMEGQRDA